MSLRRLRRFPLSQPRRQSTLADRLLLTAAASIDACVVPRFGTASRMAWYTFVDSLFGLSAAQSLRVTNLVDCFVDSGLPRWRSSQSSIPALRALRHAFAIGTRRSPASSSNFSFNTV